MNSGSVTDEVNNYSTVSIKNVTQPGDYPVTVRVIDLEDEARWADVTIVFHIVKTVELSGKVTDTKGNPLSKVKISCIMKDKTNKYCTYEKRSSESIFNYFTNAANTDDNGEFKMQILPGMYDLCVLYTGTKRITEFQYNVKLKQGEKNFVIRLD